MIEKAIANVWDAIEDTPEQAAEMTRRSELMILLEDYLNKINLSPHEAALMLGVSEACISDLREGKINELGLPILERMADAAASDPKCQAAQAQATK